MIMNIKICQLVLHLIFAKNVLVFTCFQWFCPSVTLVAV